MNFIYKSFYIDRNFCELHKLYKTTNDDNNNDDDDVCIKPQSKRARVEYGQQQEAVS